MRTTTAAGSRTGADRTTVDLDALGDLFPHRVATAAELIALGLTGQLVKRRCRPGGPWRRVHPGVLLLGSAPPTREQLVQAALRYAGRDALVTGQDALQLHGVRAARPGEPVHVLVPSGRGVRGLPSVLVERTDCPTRPVLRSGFSTVPLVRAVVDAARRSTSAGWVRHLLTEVIGSGAVRFEELRAQLAVGGGNGLRRAHQVLRELSEQTRASVHSSARELVRAVGLPAPRWNAGLTAEDGTPLGSVVAWWQQAGVAWEVDPFEFEPSPAEHAHVLRRGCRLARNGVVVLHTAAARLRHEPTAVGEELHAAYRNAVSRTRVAA
jgi:hypothetical protein